MSCCFFYLSWTRKNVWGERCELHGAGEDRVGYSVSSTFQSQVLTSKK